MKVKVLMGNKKGVKEKCYETENFKKTINTVNFLVEAELLLWADVYDIDKNELIYSVGKK